MTEFVCHEFDLPAPATKTMWTEQSLESISSSELQTVSLTSDDCLGSSNVDMVDWTDCGGCVRANPSWHQGHYDETNLFSDNVDYLATNDATCRSVVDSYVGPVGPSSWSQQQLPVPSSNGNVQRLPPEHYRLQLQQQQHYRYTCLAEREDQMVTLTGEQSTEAATQKRRLGALTMEEAELWSGGAANTLTYKGRPLRRIAPKPTTRTVAEPRQHRQTLPPKITFSVVFAKPPSSAATTAAMSTSNRTPAANHHTSDEHPSASGKTPANYFKLRVNYRIRTRV